MKSQKGSSESKAEESHHQKIAEISVVVPITERHDDLKVLYGLYRDELVRLEKDFEFVFVLVGDFEIAFRDLSELVMEDDRVRVIRLPRRLGESAALMEGFRHARGDVILTLASYIQVEPEDLEKVFAAYEAGNDLVVTKRYPRKDPIVNRIQSSVYHFLLRLLTGTPLKDVTSGMRVIRKAIVPKLVLYGDLHRFIPIFAMLRGIKVEEVPVTQREEDTQVRLVEPGIYLRRILDLVTLFFLVKFTKKPLRFFGLIGFSLFLFGLLIAGYLTTLRLLGAIELANRITTASGAGHSCGIHTTDNDKVIKLATAVKVARVMVNQPQALANSGAWTNGMPMSLTLGCGTWGGNSVSENVGYKHLMNTTWVAWPIPSTEPKLEELFSKEILDEVWD